MNFAYYKSFLLILLFHVHRCDYYGSTMRTLFYLVIATNRYIITEISVTIFTITHKKKETKILHLIDEHNSIHYMCFLCSINTHLVDKCKATQEFTFRRWRTFQCSKNLSMFTVHWLFSIFKVLWEVIRIWVSALIQFRYKRRYLMLGLNYLIINDRITF